MPEVSNSRKKRSFDGRRVRGPHCPRCDHELAPDSLTSCGACRKPFSAIRFTPPSRFHREADATSTDQAPCANHEENLAVDACGRCGAFICALCRMETDELIACPACLELLERDNSLTSLRKDLVNYGYIALYLALGGFLLFPLAPVFSIPALVYIRKNQRQNQTLGERLGVAQQWWGLALALLSLIPCVTMWFFIFAKLAQ